MANQLPPAPSLEHLRKQAKALRAAFERQDAAAADLITSYHPEFPPSGRNTYWKSSFSLADAQFTVARSYGFASWPQLKSHLAGLEHPLRTVWVEALFQQDARKLRTMLDKDSALADSLHAELDDAFRTVKRFAVASLLYATAGSPCQTPACWASRSAYAGNLNVVQCLLAAGAHPNIHSHHGRPMHWVSRPEIARYLLEHGADINLWHDNGGSPLCFALWQNQPERMRMLLDLGADPNGANPVSGETCLHFAARTTDGSATHSIRILLDAGANPLWRSQSPGKRLWMRPDAVMPGRKF